jgi:transitional endoplasmic reticulum ATPase
MICKFQIKEDPRLTRSSRVILQAENQSVWNSAVVHISNAKKECLGFVESVVSGPNILLIDKFLRLCLGAKEDSWVEIKDVESEPNIASKAVVSIPPEWVGTSIVKFVKEGILNKPVTINQEIPIYTLKGSELIRISKIIPSPFAIIAEETEIEYQPSKDLAKRDIKVTYSDIGGLGPAISKIRELVEYPMRLPKAMSYIGIEPPKGILLYGPPGTGKTLIAKALSGTLEVHFSSIQGPEIVSGIYGDTEKILREKFEEAQSKAPAILLIDEIDSITPKRDSSKGELESRMVAMLLTLMDGLKETKGIIVIGTTNRPNAIDPALRRPGRLEYEIYIGIPNIDGRREILDIYTKRKGMPLAKDVDIQNLAERTHGFVGADIAFLCREAGYSAFRRYFNIDTQLDENSFDFSSMEVAKSDFEEALKNISPSALREVLVQVPKDVTWKKIGGLENIKSIVEENIVHGIKNPHVFKEMGIRPARGFLLYGPPGTGKTLIAKALANECEANFISIKGPELRSKWFGESEEKIRFIFDTARRATPCLVFFDEIDALAPARGKDASGLTDSIVNQLLAEMDGVQGADGVYVVGATNRPELIDEALLRPGRFNYQVEVPLPNKEGLKAIFSIHLRKDILGDDVNIEEVVENTEGLSGAEVAEVCRLAGLQALREVGFKEANKITMRHLLSAIESLANKRKGNKNEY